VTSLVVHLRLHFQLLLAPVYLWGWLIAGGGLSRPVLWGFIAFHVFLYSGATAYNSYYDRDAGPVGGLAHPPHVTPALLPFSLAIQAIGLALSALINPTFTAIYVLFAVLSVAYSHPRIRLKAHPWASLVTVGLGQGILAFLGAWAATRGDLSGAASPDGLLGAAAATLLILALYPLTQLYQVDEDTRRGDRTVAAVLGSARCFAFALGCTTVGGVLMLIELDRRFGPLDVVVVGLGLTAQVLALAWWARRLDIADVLRTYRQVMRLNTLSASALGAYLVVRLALDRG
jgi:1,4-dihydroxy-2-naphthoate octaprenyltransferase